MIINSSDLDGASTWHDEVLSEPPHVRGVNESSYTGVRMFNVTFDLTVVLDVYNSTSDSLAKWEADRSLFISSNATIEDASVGRSGFSSMSSTGPRGWIEIIFVRGNVLVDMWAQDAGSGISEARMAEMALHIASIQDSKIEAFH
jgi:hypothetical protein